eukprot:1651587-Prymnesium_polylepis.2
MKAAEVRGTVPCAVTGMPGTVVSVADSRARSSSPFVVEKMMMSCRSRSYVVSESDRRPGFRWLLYKGGEISARDPRPADVWDTTGRTTAGSRATADRTSVPFAFDQCHDQNEWQGPVTRQVRPEELPAPGRVPGDGDARAGRNPDPWSRTYEMDPRDLPHRLHACVPKGALRWGRGPPVCSLADQRRARRLTAEGSWCRPRRIPRRAQGPCEHARAHGERSGCSHGAFAPRPWRLLSAMGGGGSGGGSADHAPVVEDGLARLARLLSDEVRQLVHPVAPARHARGAGAGVGARAPRQSPRRASAVRRSSMRRGAGHAMHGRHAARLVRYCLSSFLYSALTLSASAAVSVLPPPASRSFASAASSLRAAAHATGGARSGSRGMAGAARARRPHALHGRHAGAARTFRALADLRACPSLSAACTSAIACALRCCSACAHVPARAAAAGSGVGHGSFALASGRGRAGRSRSAQGLRARDRPRSPPPGIARWKDRRAARASAARRPTGGARAPLRRRSWRPARPSPRRSARPRP